MSNRSCYEYPTTLKGLNISHKLFLRKGYFFLYSKVDRNTKPILHMSTYTQILYQIVFGTKHRLPTLTKKNRDELFKYMSGVIQKKNCKLLQINGVEDHIHILICLHPSVALADLVKDLKMSSITYIRENKLFPNFDGWQNGYGAFTYSQNATENLVNYIKNQEEHHRKSTFIDEYRRILEAHDINFEEKYL